MMSRETTRITIQRGMAPDAQCHVDRDQERLVGERVEESTQLARHVEALGQEAIDGVADAGDQEHTERNLHLARHDGPDDDRDQHDAAQGDDVRNTHAALPGTRCDLKSGPLQAEPVDIYIV